MRFTISRTSRPVKTSESPHDSSDDSIANAATNATAPRAVFGIDASHRISRAIGGDDATTNPPTITIAICMVKFTSDQNPLPNSAAIVTGVTPANMPPMKTSTMAASANTNASGNHRSQTSAMRDPARARRFECMAAILSSMPEGDSIYRAAQALHRALAGKTVTSFETVLPKLARVDDDSPLKGRTIERVTSAGKNLIIEFSGDLHLHTHMKMNGSWHIYRPGERWKRPRRDMRIVIGTDDYVAVAFTVPVAEFHTSRTLTRDADLRGMGPDLLGQSFDRDEALRRIRAKPDDEIANVLLNQRVLAGIGNIWK